MDKLRKFYAGRTYTTGIATRGVFLVENPVPAIYKLSVSNSHGQFPGSFGAMEQLGMTYPLFMNSLDEPAFDFILAG